LLRGYFPFIYGDSREQALASGMACCVANTQKNCLSKLKKILDNIFFTSYYISRNEDLKLSMYNKRTPRVAALGVLARLGELLRLGCTVIRLYPTI